MAFRIKYQETIKMLQLLTSISQSVLSIPRLAKRMIALCVDISFCVLAVWLAFYLRLGEFSPLTASAKLALVASIALAIPVFIVDSLHNAVATPTSCQLLRLHVDVTLVVRVVTTVT